MPAACGELRRQGHAVREVSIARRGVRVRGGWAVGGTTYRAVRDAGSAGRRSGTRTPCWCARSPSRAR